MGLREGASRRPLIGCQLRTLPEYSHAALKSVVHKNTAPDFPSVSVKYPDTKGKGK